MSCINGAIYVYNEGTVFALIDRSLRSCGAHDQISTYAGGGLSIALAGYVYVQGMNKFVNRKTFIVITGLLQETIVSLVH